ncbi:MAG: sugar transferase [Gemmatimonadaceae bacterium]|nr:sugar transferase [Gemmatimonadaceae bacterium]
MSQPGPTQPANASPLLRLLRPGQFRPFAESAEARVVLIGHGDDLHRALTHPAVESGRFSMVGAFVVDIESGLPADQRRAIEQLFDGLEADALFLAGPVGPSVTAWAMDVAMGHAVPLWSVMPTEVPPNADPRVIWAGREPLLQLADQRRSRIAMTAKRTVDILGAAAGIILTAPLMAVLSLTIMIESRGLPFFRHIRVTRNGRRFGCLKLRTMYANAEEHLQSDAELYDAYLLNNYKIPEDHDPRITRFGRFLRRTSLDELPQFWNVLIGDMSLVGPRPVVPPELEHYPGAKRRLFLSLRPGLTGAWAVSGRHAVGYPERAEIELGYVRHWSLGTDLMVLLKTFRAVMSY